MDLGNNSDSNGVNAVKNVAMAAATAAGMPGAPETASVAKKKDKDETNSLPTNALHQHNIITSINLTFSQVRKIPLT